MWFEHFPHLTLAKICTEGINSSTVIVGSWNLLSEIKILDRIPYTLKWVTTTDNYGFSFFLKRRNLSKLTDLCINFTEGFFCVQYK